MTGRQERPLVGYVGTSENRPVNLRQKRYSQWDTLTSTTCCHVVYQFGNMFCNFFTIFSQQKLSRLDKSPDIRLWLIQGCGVKQALTCNCCDTHQKAFVMLRLYPCVLHKENGKHYKIQSPKFNIRVPYSNRQTNRWTDILIEQLTGNY